MAEETAVAEPQKGTGKIVGAGKVQSFNPNIQLPNQQGNEQNQNVGAIKTQAEIDAEAAASGLTAEKKAENLAAGLNEDGSPKATAAALTDVEKQANIAKGLNEDGSSKAVIEPPKPLTDEEVKAEYEKRFPTTAAISEEEKLKQEQTFEKRMLDMYVEAGLKDGKKKTEELVAEYAAIKHAMSADLTELSISELTKELKAIGVTDPEQIAAIQKERYYQIEQAEIDAIEDPKEKELAQKKFDYGKSKFENKGKQVKENAVDFYNNLKEAVNQKDFFTQKESEFVSNVEAHFKEVPRKMTLELGKMDDIEIPPVEYEVPEEAIAKAQETLKNPASRKQLLFNTTDGSLNLKSIAELVLKAEMFDSAAKTMYLTGGHREVEKFEKIFPKNPNALGVGGNSQANNGKPGKLIKAGPPERFRPAVNQ